MAKPALPIDKQIELLVQRGLPTPLPPDDDYEYEYPVDLDNPRHPAAAVPTEPCEENS